MNDLSQLENKKEQSQIPMIAPVHFILYTPFVLLTQEHPQMLNQDFQ